MTYQERAQLNADAYRVEMERAVSEGNDFAAHQAAHWFAWWSQAARTGERVVAIVGGPLLAVPVRGGEP
jgi:hypothetical protein